MEVGGRVVVGNSIVVRVGGDFVRVDLGRSIGRSWMGKDRRCMDCMSHRSNTMVPNKSMSNNAMMTHCVSNWMSNNSVTCPMQSIRMVSNRSDIGSKGF